MSFAALMKKRFSRVTKSSFRRATKPENRHGKVRPE